MFSTFHTVRVKCSQSNTLKCQPYCEIYHLIIEKSASRFGLDALRGPLTPNNINIEKSKNACLETFYISFGLFWHVKPWSTHWK